jgi:hypothetical protein
MAFCDILAVGVRDRDIAMGDNTRNTAAEASSIKTASAAAPAEGQPSQLVDWSKQSSKTGTTMDRAGLGIVPADSPPPPPPPDVLSVNYNTNTGLDKPIGPGIHHLTINADHGINLATNFVYGPGIVPHFHTVIGEPTQGNTQLKGQFDLPADLKDVTLHYKDAQGAIHNDTYEAAQLRLAGTANAINPYVNDFKKPDPDRPVAAQYPNTTSVYEFGYRMSDISTKALSFLEQQLVNDKASSKTGNPYIDINLAEVRVGMAVKHYTNAFGPYAPDVRAREKQWALQEISEAQKNYASAIRLSQARMAELPNAGDNHPHVYGNPTLRRFAPASPQGEDYYPLVYGSAMDTAAWRYQQLNELSSRMSVNSNLPPRLSTRIDNP